jgi:hypothetical protein
MSLISEALFLEATAADTTRKLRVEAGALPTRDDGDEDEVELETPTVALHEQARAIAAWIYAGREGTPSDQRASFPGLGWLRQPAVYSDREWILEIALQYRALTRDGDTID